MQVRDPNLNESLGPEVSFNQTSERLGGGRLDQMSEENPNYMNSRSRINVFYHPDWAGYAGS